MIGKNIKYYRLKSNMSQDALAQAVGVKKMTISHYESGKRAPDYETSRKIAAALNIPFTKLMENYSDGLDIRHVAFRKHSTVAKRQQNAIIGEIDRYLERLFEAASFIGDASLPAPPDIRQIEIDDYKAAGRHLREILDLPLSGPVGNITDILENKGFIICPVNIAERGFSGNSGSVNGRPYIAVNTTMPAERQRFTLVHELAHLAFLFNDEQDEESEVDKIAGAFLLPGSDIVRELGPKRKDIRSDLRNIQREYGISMTAIVIRAYQVGIITKSTYEITMKWMSGSGLRTDSPSEITPEKTHLLEQLTFRAVAEEEIGVSKAAELLEMPLMEVRRICYGGV